MTKLLTPKEIEDRYFNNKQVLSTEFKETLGNTSITLIINTITYSYNWIQQNISNCKNITYLGKEPGFIKLTTNHILEYYHRELIIYTTNQYWNDDSTVTLNDGIEMPRIHLGSWMDSVDRQQGSTTGDERTWATAWPLTSVIPWINSSIDNNIRIGIDTALEYRTQRQIGNILKYYAKYGKHKDSLDINSIFITTKIPCTNTNTSVGAGNGVIGPPLKNPKEYAINLIILNLLELGWITADNIKSTLNGLDWTTNPKPKPDEIVSILQNLSATISRTGDGNNNQDSPPGIDLLLLHHTPKDSDTYIGIFTGFELAKQGGLIKNYGFSNVPDQDTIDGIIDDLKNKNVRGTPINPVVIQQQCGGKPCEPGNLTRSDYNIKNQWVMTHCYPPANHNCKSIVTDPHTIVHSLNMNPEKCVKYASLDTVLPYDSAAPSPSSDTNVWYITEDPNSLSCSSINIDDVYLGENSYFTTQKSCNTAISNEPSTCTFNMNRENPCPKGYMCWPPANDDGIYNNSDRYQNQGICIKGDATPTTSSITTYTTSSNEDYTPAYYDDTLTHELKFNTADDYNYNFIFDNDSYIISDPQGSYDKMNNINGLNSDVAYYWIYIGLLKKPADMVKSRSVPQEAYISDDTPGPGPSPDPGKTLCENAKCGCTFCTGDPPPKTNPGRCYYPKWSPNPDCYSCCAPTTNGGCDSNMLGAQLC